MTSDPLQRCTERGNNTVIPSLYLVIKSVFFCSRKRMPAPTDNVHKIHGVCFANSFIESLLPTNSYPVDVARYGYGASTLCPSLQDENPASRRFFFVSGLSSTRIKNTIQLLDNSPPNGGFFFNVAARSNTSF